MTLLPLSQVSQSFACVWLRLPLGWRNTQVECCLQGLSCGCRYPKSWDRPELLLGRAVGTQQVTACPLARFFVPTG